MRVCVCVRVCACVCVHASAHVCCSCSVLHTSGSNGTVMQEMWCTQFCCSSSLAEPGLCVCVCVCVCVSVCVITSETYAQSIKMYHRIPEQNSRCQALASYLI